MEEEWPARCAATEALLIIDPVFCAIITGAVCFMPSITERTSNAIASSNPSTETEVIEPVGAGPPALLKRQSMRPNRSIVVSPTRLQSDSLVASAGTKTALGPSRSAIAGRARDDRDLTVH